MKSAKRLLIGVSAFALVAILAAVLAPKTAHAVVSTLVTVANPASQPVFTMGVDNPDQSPLRLRFNIVVPQGAASAFDYPAAVPEGKCMVVEYISGSCAIPHSSGVGVADIAFEPPENGPSGSISTYHVYLLPVTRSATNALGFDGYVLSQLVRLYADGSASSNMGASVVLTGAAPQGGVICYFEVSGHTTNMP
jgi:hypothetical protein